MNIGDKVVCVDDSPCRCRACPGIPIPIEAGIVYVVARAETFGFPFPKYLHGVWIDVLGVSMPRDPWHQMYCLFESSRFRKLDEMKKESGNKKSKTPIGIGAE